MNDQACSLRRLAWQARQQALKQAHLLKKNYAMPPAAMKVIAVTSGKGGVGKTHIVVNLAYALSCQGQRVMIFDADIGLTNVDILLGLEPQFNIQHVIDGKKTFKDVLMTESSGIHLLTSGSGHYNLFDLSIHQRTHLLNEVGTLNFAYDFLLIDTGAGISNTVTSFNASAHDIIIVVTPEPTSLTDAYTLIKRLVKQHHRKEFSIVVNTVSSTEEANKIFLTLNIATERFLGFSLHYLGFIRYDNLFTKAVRQQQPLMKLYPDSAAANCFHDLAKSITELPRRLYPQGNFYHFWSQLLTKAL